MLTPYSRAKGLAMLGMLNRLPVFSQVIIECQIYLTLSIPPVIFLIYIEYILSVEDNIGTLIMSKYMPLINICIDSDIFTSVAVYVCLDIAYMECAY